MVIAMCKLPLLLTTVLILMTFICTCVQACLLMYMRECVWCTYIYVHGCLGPGEAGG